MIFLVPKCSWWIPKIARMSTLQFKEIPKSLNFVPALKVAQPLAQRIQLESSKECNIQLWPAPDFWTINKMQTDPSTLPAAAAVTYHSKRVQKIKESLLKHWRKSSIFLAMTLNRTEDNWRIHFGVKICPRVSSWHQALWEAPPYQSLGTRLDSRLLRVPLQQEIVVLPEPEYAREEALEITGAHTPVSQFFLPPVNLSQVNYLFHTRYPHCI